MQTAQRASAPRPASLDTVLTYAWGAGEFTATDAMSAVRLTRSTTIEALDTLARLGLLTELPNARAVGDYRKGRPARRFAFHADAGIVIGIDAGHVHLDGMAADLRGTVLARVHTELGIEHDTAEERRAAVGVAIDDLIRRAGRDAGDALAICVGVPAPVDRFGVSPIQRDGFWQRMNPDLVDALADRAPLVRVENDASLAAIAEGVAGAAAGCENYVALLAGGRLGSGVVVDGRLLWGAHGGVGEMRALDHVDGVGGAVGLGHRAKEWAREAIRDGDLDPRGALAALRPEALEGGTVLELAAQGDPDAMRIATQVGTVLARVVRVLHSMYDPEIVVICGGVSSGMGLVVDTARELLATSLDFESPRIVVSQLGADVVAKGAVAAAVELARSHALDLLYPTPAAGA
ncbi:putative transcriptional regulator, ROK family [Nostocoides japonicum T1-X7]|uniref:Putative transcriptional regulator, ROK family n=1 Tax=Nostocoides japonicum T1-X7 TaxID=1194083 RepID=A0A077LVV8_9MICO|nr:ROK family protein [Tetrasphaera japonica]CCH77836.1 putative transcriptional regulator, ROK family [Tetrasphaera japonica T1-X7]